MIEWLVLAVSGWALMEQAREGDNLLDDVVFFVGFGLVLFAAVVSLSSAARIP